LNIVENEDGTRTAELSESDVASAIRGFICACHPEFRTGYIINGFDVQPATAKIEPA
jgi:hypothetical protein